MNTTTPRTEARLIKDSASQTAWVTADFSRTLERELAATQDLVITSGQALGQVTKDRDEWKEIATMLFRSYATPAWEQAVERFLTKKSQSQ